jgi:hypothetical protein
VSQGRVCLEGVLEAGFDGAAAAPAAGLVGTAVAPAAEAAEEEAGATTCGRVVTEDGLAVDGACFWSSAEAVGWCPTRLYARGLPLGLMISRCVREVPFIPYILPSAPASNRIPLHPLPPAAPPPAPASSSRVSAAACGGAVVVEVVVAVGGAEAIVLYFISKICCGCGGGAEPAVDAVGASPPAEEAEAEADADAAVVEAEG